MQYKIFLLHYREANLVRESPTQCKVTVKYDTFFPTQYLSRGQSVQGRGEKNLYLIANCKALLAQKQVKAAKNPNASNVS